MKTNPNDPVNSAEVAFAEGTQQESFQSDHNKGTYMGLTKREYFAALAMQGMLARSPRDLHEMRTAVQFADALIDELNKN